MRSTGFGSARPYLRDRAPLNGHGNCMHPLAEEGVPEVGDAGLVRSRGGHEADRPPVSSKVLHEGGLVQEARVAGREARLVEEDNLTPRVGLKSLEERLEEHRRVQPPAVLARAKRGLGVDVLVSRPCDAVVHTLVVMRARVRKVDVVLVQPGVKPFE